MKYEYALIEIDGDNKRTARHLSELGEDEWEAFAVKNNIVYMKREYKSRMDRLLENR